MVHALEVIHRTLVPEGILIDLRPLTDHWPVEVVSGGVRKEVGRVTDLPSGQATDEAANRTIEEASRQGWFVRESEITFPLYYYWQTPGEMVEHIKEKWSDESRLEEEVISAAQAAWASAGKDRRMSVRLKMLLTRWRKR
jgi:hypothetical protein